MNIISAQSMAFLEKQAYQQGHKEKDFMEKAGRGIALAIQEYVDRLDPVLLLCGKGNNGGDAFVAGVYLLEQGYLVSAIQLDSLDLCSPLCQENHKRFVEAGGQLFHESLPDFHLYSLILDGIFGTGFKGQVKEPYASLIRGVNASKVPIISIDIPSGLNGNTGEASDSAILAKETLYLGLPKVGFFLQNGWNHIGRLRPIDFGLPVSIANEVKAEMVLMTEKQARGWMPPIVRNRHKYSRGYVVGIAGSPNMPGAAILSSLSALRSGCGIIRLLHPDGMQVELAAAPYEIIRVPYCQNDTEKVLELMKKASAHFIGPGMGLSDETANLLSSIMPFLEHPCVIDADALTLYAKHAFDLPKQAILTPHLGEMKRLLNNTEISAVTLDLLQKCQQYVEEKQVTLVLKGAPTFILHPGQPILVNATGDPGMATAGSGDVLTGLIASLCAQGLSCHQAAAFGVYLHGLAGEYAAAEKTSRSLIATDLIDYFSDAYWQLDLPSHRASKTPY